MNDTLIKNWNSVVGVDDEVHHLGDFLMNPKYLWVVGQLNGIKYLVPGNHDKCYRGSEKWVSKYLDAGFEWVLPRVSNLILSSGQEVVLSHVYYGITDPRFSDLAPKDEGLPLLHGHSHSQPENKVRRSAKGTLQIDIGVVGNNYTPYSEDEIISIIDREIG